MRSTRTYATLEVPAHLHAFVKKALLAAGYDHAINREEGDEHLDMHGIALTKMAGGDIESLRWALIDGIEKSNEVAFKAGYNAGFETGFTEVGAGPDAACEGWNIPAATAIAVIKAMDNLVEGLGG